MTKRTLSDSLCLRQVRASLRPCRYGCSALDLLLPPSCACCGASLSDSLDCDQLCDPCRNGLSLEKIDCFCAQCGVPLTTPVAGSPKCPRCLQGPSLIDRVVPWGVYERELRRSVIRAKLAKETPLAASLGCLLAEKLAEHEWSQRADVVVPIPKYWFKRMVQGTNTAEVLVDVVGRRLGIPTAPAALVVRRPTRKQSLLNVFQRRANLRGSLRVRTGYDFQATRVLVVDDIMTTGATAREAARALREGGACEVSLAVVARAISEWA